MSAWFVGGVQRLFKMSYSSGVGGKSQLDKRKTTAEGKRCLYRYGAWYDYTSARRNFTCAECADWRWRVWSRSCQSRQYIIVHQSCHLLQCLWVSSHASFLQYSKARSSATTLPLTEVSCLNAHPATRTPRPDLPSRAYYTSDSTHSPPSAARSEVPQPASAPSPPPRPRPSQPRPAYPIPLHLDPSPRIQSETAHRR